jgi:putative Ig domain-containing protein
MKTQKNDFLGLSVERLPRLALYKPLAALLAIMMAPAFSWMEGQGTQASVRPFEARAQGSTCQSTTNSIIQNYCTPEVGGQNSYNLYTDLAKLESDAVGAYLAAHNLPASDAHVIYDYGRADLRDAIRAYIISTMLGVINTPPSSRTNHQKVLYLWAQDLIWANEIALYKAAYNQYLAWQADPCKFQLDPTLAQAYNISYDGAPFCGNQLTNVFAGPTVPAPSYFLAYGLEQAYEDWGKHCPSTNSCGQLPILPDVSAKLSEVVGIALGTAPLLAGVVAFPLYANLTVAAGAFGQGPTQIPEPDGWEYETTIDQGSGEFTDAVISGSTVDEIGIEASVGSPVLIVLMALAIGVTAGFQTFSNQDLVNQLNDLTNQTTAATNTPPDLASFVSDSTGLGLLKFQNTMIAATLRANADGTLTDQPSTAPLPAHQSGTDLNFQPLSGPISDTLSYEGWNAEIWSAKTWGGWFVQTCADGPKLDSQLTGKCAQTDSISADLNFFDWSFAQWLERGSEQARFTAARFHDVDFLGNIRNKFTITRTGGPAVNGKPLSGAATTRNCPAGAGGVSPGPYVSADTACWSYISNQMPIVLGDGSRGLINLVDGVAPAFAGPTNLPFATGVASRQTINVGGSPAPSGCVSSTNIPDDFTIGGHSLGQLQTFGCNFNYLPGNPQVTFDGNASLTPATYFVNIQYSNSVGTTNSTYTINLTSQLGFVSSGTMNVTAGSPTTYTVVATGYPRPKLTMDPLYQPLLNGLTFQDNGDGTATISGTYNSIATQQCSNISPQGPSGTNCGIIATIYNPDNSIKQQVEQQFAIIPALPPAATIINPSATFTAGVPNSALLTATGATTPVSWCFGDGSMGQFPLVCASNPPLPWLTLTDNGNGTAKLSGTPPVGTSGPVNVNIVPGAADSAARSYQYTITVTNAPLFSSANTATFTVGTAGSFTVAATEGAVSLANSLPVGLQFAASGDTATISGTPAALTGGQYPLSLTVDAGALGSATQNLMLNINEAPKITSPPVVTFFAGQPGSFGVTTSGFPSTASQPGATAPGMQFVSTGLPSFLTASNLNPAGFLTGTLAISGTPQTKDIGTYTASLQASNGFGDGFGALSVRVLPFNPSVPVSLIPQTGARLVGTNIVLSVVLPNAGSATAGNVTITSAKFTSDGGTVTAVEIDPARGVSIPSGSSATFNLIFPNTVGFSYQTLGAYTISVSYSGGSLNFSGRISLN